MFAQKITKTVLTGIVNTQKEYGTWSDGGWAQDAPECLMTTNIAREIWAHHSLDFHLTLEAKISQVVDHTQGMRTGRVDIALWEPGLQRTLKNVTAIIEVKKHVSRFHEDIEEDVCRICDVFERNENLRLGLMAYFTSHKDQLTRRAMKHFIEERVARIENDCEEYVRSRNMELSNHLSNITVVDECGHEQLETRAWVAGVMSFVTNRTKILGISEIPIFAIRDSHK